MTAAHPFPLVASVQGIELPEYPLMEDGETLDMLVVTACYRAGQVIDCVAHLQARAVVHSLGGTLAQADEAERLVRKRTGFVK